MEPHELIDLTTARKAGRIPRRPDGKPVDPSTTWRWIRKGIQGPDGERIKLEVTYVGSRPYVTQNGIDDFFQAVTEAKLERHRRAEELAADVTNAELEAAGLAVMSLNNSQAINAKADPATTTGSVSIRHPKRRRGKHQ